MQRCLHVARQHPPLRDRADRAPSMASGCAIKSAQTLGCPDTHRGSSSALPSNGVGPRLNGLASRLNGLASRLNGLERSREAHRVAFLASVRLGPSRRSATRTRSSAARARSSTARARSSAARARSSAVRARPTAFTTYDKRAASFHFSCISAQRLGGPIRYAVFRIERFCILYLKDLPNTAHSDTYLCPVPREIITAPLTLRRQRPVAVEPVDQLWVRSQQR